MIRNRVKILIPTLYSVLAIIRVVTAPQPFNFVFAFLVHCFSVFQLVLVYLLFRFIPSVIFGYVTFHSFVLVFFMRTTLFLLFGLASSAVSFLVPVVITF